MTNMETDNLYGYETLDDLNQSTRSSTTTTPNGDGDDQDNIGAATPAFKFPAPLPRRSFRQYSDASTQSDHRRRSGVMIPHTSTDSINVFVENIVHRKDSKETEQQQEVDDDDDDDDDDTVDDDVFAAFDDQQQQQQQLQQQLDNSYSGHESFSSSSRRRRSSIRSSFQHPASSQASSSSSPSPQPPSSLLAYHYYHHMSSFSNSLGISEEDSLELQKFVKGQRLKEWIRIFRRSDPRYQILNFFNDVAQEGASNNMDDNFGSTNDNDSDDSDNDNGNYTTTELSNYLNVSPLLRAFYRASVFTVWRPTSFDAIRRMMLGEGVGKGLDIKGKSAKKGRLSGFVPFLQIHETRHKRDIRTLSRTSKVRIFYHTNEYRTSVADYLNKVSNEMMEQVREAMEYLKNMEEKEKKNIDETNDSTNNNNNDSAASEAAAAAIDNDDDDDDAKFEWACETKLWDMEDPSVTLIDDYVCASTRRSTLATDGKPHQGKWGIEINERLFWEGLVIRQNIERVPGSEDETGRPSEPNFQMMNFGALRKYHYKKNENLNKNDKDKDKDKDGTTNHFRNKKKSNKRTSPKKSTRAVITQYVDPNDTDIDPLSPLNLVMAYEEPHNHRVMPVVSDFDAFMVGTRGVKYTEPIPQDQFSVLQWCIDQIESILESDNGDGDGENNTNNNSNSNNNNNNNASWTSRWLDVLKQSARKGFHPTIPPLGYSDPKSQNIMKHAIHRLSKEGAVRHGAECFNFYFPQELDDEYLVISDNLSGSTLPWRYVDKKGLQDILKVKIEEGYTFPLHPKWILCDDGWKEVYDKLCQSKASNVQESLQIWYPPESGIREKIEDIYNRYPEGFVRRKRRQQQLLQQQQQKQQRHDDEGGEIGNLHDDDDAEEEEEKDGTTAMDLAELELKYYLTLQRAKRKLRGLIIWQRLLRDKRAERAAKANAEMDSGS